MSCSLGSRRLHAWAFRRLKNPGPRIKRLATTRFIAFAPNVPFHFPRLSANILPVAIVADIRELTVHLLCQLSSCFWRLQKKRLPEGASMVLTHVVSEMHSLSSYSRCSDVGQVARLRENTGVPGCVRIAYVKVIRTRPSAIITLTIMSSQCGIIA